MVSSSVFIGDALAALLDACREIDFDVSLATLAHEGREPGRGN
jgi:hypothetical protein